MAGRGWSAMVARIGNEIQRDNITVHEERIKRAICDAIAYWKDAFEPWFMESAVTFNTVADQKGYTRDSLLDADDNDLPANLVNVLDVRVVGNGDYRTQLCKIRRDQMETRFETSTTQFTGLPTDYAIYNDTLYLWPVPDDAYEIDMLVTLDPGSPYYEYDASGKTWAFYDPTGTTISDDYTNDWFTKGERLIRNYAKYLLFTDVFVTPELAQVMRGTAEEEAQRLEIRRNRYGGSTFTGWL